MCFKNAQFNVQVMLTPLPGVKSAIMNAESRVPPKIKILNIYICTSRCNIFKGRNFIIDRVSRLLGECDSIYVFFPLYYVMYIHSANTIHY